MPNEKWELFKNFLHNELGITKEDIREWVKEAVREEAVKLVNNTYGEFSPERVVKKVLLEHSLFEGNHFKKEVIFHLGQILSQQLKIVSAEPEEPRVLDIDPAPCGCVRVIQDSIDKTLFVCSCGETRRRVLQSVTRSNTEKEI